MPSPRSQLKGRRGWSDEHESVLLDGHDYFCIFQDGEPRKVPTRSREGWDEQEHVEERLRQAVDDLGDELLATWIDAKPFSRPWFWWRFKAREPRRCLTGPHRYDRPEYAGWSRLYFGLPAIALGPDFGRDEEYESEFDYLIRLDDLLTDHERELLTKESTP